MKILSWNVNGRVGDAAQRQLRAVLRRKPDVIALQEVTARPFRRYPGNYPIWLEGLTKAGYSVTSTIDLVALPYPEPPYDSPPLPPPRDEQHDHIQRKNFNLIASRHPIAVLPGLSFDDPKEAKLAFPEKYVAARVRIDRKEFDIHNAHLPPGVSRGLLKVHAFEAIRRRVDREPDNRTILCGDFNAPWSEDEQGPVIIEGGPWPKHIQLRWAKSEKRLLTNPHLRDTYRDVHRAGYPFPASHYTGREQNPTSHRYDYIFASAELKTRSCDYLTRWLAAGISDHAAVEAELV